MKKLIYKFALLAVLLVLMNWIYGKFFFKNDLLKYSDEVQLSWKIAEDSCEMVYTGESSNHSFAWSDKDQRKISDFVFEHFPDMKCGDMTKDASHAEVYYYLFKSIPEDAPVKTIIVTMNMRSFGYLWIDSDLETPIQKQLVLLKDNPPLFNRFMLAFKAYDMKSNSERNTIREYHKDNDKIVFPYDFKYDNIGDWDRAKANEGIVNSDGSKNRALTILACHFIKTYAFQIHDNNPRLKDFDNIIKLAKERGWNVIFNLMAENVDRANELVGDDLLFIMRQNRDYLLNRYGNIGNVTIVDNLGDVRNGFYIDQDWTTEHYFEDGRRIIANNVAIAAEKHHPDMYVEKNINYLNNHYRIDITPEAQKIDVENPCGLTINKNTSEVERKCEKVYISAEIMPNELSDEPVIAFELYKNNEKTRFTYLKIKDLVKATDKWEFTTTVLPIDSTFFDADEFRIFISNPSESPLFARSLDVSFEFDEYARTNK